MADTVRTDAELQQAVQGALETVKVASAAALESAVDKTAKEVVKETKEKAPKRTGVYAKSWTSGKTGEGTGAHRVGVYGREVYQKKKPGLTHLLQDGHEIKGAARFRKNKDRTDAFKHIPPEAEVEKAFEDNLLAEINKEMGK